MITTGDLRKGLVLNIDGELVRIMDFQHVKLGRGSAFVRLTLKNLRTGAITQRTFQAGSTFEDVRLERRRVQFLYRDGDELHFMDLDTYEQPVLTTEMVGEAIYYLKENDVVDLLTYDGEPISIELPTAVELRVVATEPGVRGDTATGATKPATLETGLVITVPLFVDVGDTVKVDTRTGEYIERVSR